MSNGNAVRLMSGRPTPQADGTSFAVISNGEGCKMPMLAVVAIRPKGEREVLA